MTWQPVTQPPQSVGPCEINDVFGHTHKVQWDGRNFRWAEGQFAGNVMTHYNGDQWRSLDGNETKETEMLNEHDLEDMRPEPAAVPAPYAEGYTDAIEIAAFYVADHCESGEHHADVIRRMRRPDAAAPQPSPEPESPLAKTYPRSED
jgi:hypothetical protein